ncbi:2-oxo-hept-4-ene-1,7-dioate hydratase [Sphingomonas profundi]|uniref:2-oxo-hept-4-ene-1,7-dioate hydratase n=1 Tax=Alterirhizorhabdus profundi TaxID=2681549 RepID=UPI0012E75CCC|nr:2-oxo-hepta-3-ene-1,7-dioic acid hydratase [Sphingomonas profundi]
MRAPVETLPADAVADAARALHEAERTHIPIRMFSLQHPAMTMDDAYRVQHAWMDIKRSEGREVWGHKIGLTSRAMQAAVGITTPDSGYLLDDMFYADGAEVPTGRFIAPRIEVELAFVMKKKLAGPRCTIHDVLNATEFVQPAIEILDSRAQRVDPDTGVTRKIVDTVADNAANGAIVTGGRPQRPDALDMRWIAAICARNGQVEETGVAAGVLNHPAYGIAWLAERLTSYGDGIEAGQTVLSGSFIRPIDGRKGDTFLADFGPCGTVSFHFS